LIEENNKVVKEDIRLVQERYANTKKQYDLLEAEIKRRKELYGVSYDANKLAKDIEDSVLGTFGASASDSLEDILAQRKADLLAQKDALKSYRSELNGTSHDLKVMTKDQDKNTDSTGKNKDAIEKNNEALRRRKQDLADLMDIENEYYESLKNKENERLLRQIENS
jgi:hypothetical protein